MVTVMLRRGLRARAGLILGVTLALGVAQASAQAPGAVQVGAPVPDRLELSRLIWSTMAAIDHANLSGNYSVLRDLSAPGFQANNDAAKLTQIFASLRTQRVDLSTTMLLAPTFTAPPSIVGAGLMRLTGQFGIRPVPINFDLIYQYSAGRWKLFGVSIQPAPIAATQPAPVAPPRKKP